MIYTLTQAPPNPTLEFAQSLLWQVPTEATEILSIGGGSVMDVGKWLAKELKLKHTVIPTTAGTGSEVTKYVVLTVDGKKTTFTDEAYIPTSYNLIPENLVTLPPEQTISGGLDALSQALESLWSKNATNESKKYSHVAIDLVLGNLLQSLKEPKNLIYRMNMLMAANMSGRAINITKTNVCHAISYPLTEQFKIPHGTACGMSLAYFSNKFLDFSVKAFISKLGLPRLLTNQDTDRIAELVKDNPKLLDCPMEVTKQDIKLALLV